MGLLLPKKQLEFSNLKLDDKVKYKDGRKKLNVEHTVKWSSLQLASMTPSAFRRAVLPEGPGRNRFGGSAPLC